MKKLFLLISILLILVPPGCAHRQGQPAIMKKELVAQLQPGITTSQQVESLFGNPQQRMVSINGEEEWEYFYAENVTSWSGQAHALKIQFEKTGIVKTYAFGRVH